MEWWRSVRETPSNFRPGLVKGFLRELYGAKTSEDANKAWGRLCGLMHMVKLSPSLGYFSFRICVLTTQHLDWP
jgi:hypothetical protein